MCAYSQLTQIRSSLWLSKQVVLVVKNPPARAGDIREPSSIPGLGRCPGGGHGNPLQYSCLENPTDGGARLRSMGSQRVGHDWSNLADTHAKIFKKKTERERKKLPVCPKANRGCCWKPKFRLTCKKVLREGLWIMPWQYLLHFESNPSRIGPSVWC